MRFVFRFLLAAALAVAASAGNTRAQEKFSAVNVFTFAPAPSDLTEVPKGDIDAKLGARAELKVRPNAGTELYLWVLNPTDDKDDFVVEVKGPKGSLDVRTKVTIPGNTWKRVRLPKPAAPATPPAAAPVAVPVPGQPPAPAPEPPPPGVELPVSKGEARLTFRLLDKAGAELKDDDGKVYGRNFPVGLLAPQDYVKTPVATVTPGKGTIGVKMVVAQDPKFNLPGAAPVQLLFPPQDALKAAVVRDGFYRRTLTFDPKQPAVPAVTLVGTIENASEKARIYVGVDGIDRAFPFTLNPLGKTAATQLLPNGVPAVRVSLTTSAVKTVATQPVARFPILVEVDNPAADDSLELRLQPVGASKELAEIVKFEATRDVHVWLDASGPTDGGLLFTTKSRDWVKSLDLTHLRGKVEITGVLETKERFVYSESIVVTVDATAPERITFLPVPPKLEKGKPLPVAATVNDPDTDITKAVFYFFTKFEDGKIPATAQKAEGVQSAKDPTVWNAEFKLAPEFRGEALVAVAFTNQVGLATDPPKVQKIEIVDPPPPKPGAGLGTIEAKVEFGGRPQPGVPVSLRDADNKEKGNATTDDKGKVKFEKVAPGNYTLVSVRKDSSTGSAGLAPVKVEADKTVKPTLTLNKIRQ